MADTKVLEVPIYKDAIYSQFRLLRFWNKDMPFVAEDY